MPPLPRLRVPALERLAARVAGEDRPRVLAAIERAEALGADLDPQQVYPEDWVAARVTGERTDAEDPAMLVGAALLSDLSAFVERLCRDARVERGEIAHGLLSPAEVQERLGLSSRSVSRYRRQGLVARRVLDPDKPNGPGAVVFSEPVVERFARSLTGPRGRGFARLDDRSRSRITRRAARYRRTLGCSAHAVAQRLGPKLGRSPETVRRFLLAHDEERRAAGRPPIFGDPAPPTARDGAVAGRLLRRGLEPKAVARLLTPQGAVRQRGARSVLRAATQDRVRRLQALALPTSAELQPADISPHARNALWFEPETDLAALLAHAEHRIATDPTTERALLWAYASLRADAARLRNRLNPAAPAADTLDEAETRLRWAARVKARLLQPQVPAIVASLNSAAGRDMRHLPARHASALLRLGFTHAAAAIERLDTRHTGRIAAPIGLAVSRAVARASRSMLGARGPAGGVQEGGGGAAVRVPGGVRFRNWTLGIAPWQAWLEIDPRLPAALHAVDERHALLCRRRFGLDSEPPATLGEVAATLGLTRMRAAVLERAALREALTAAGIRPTCGRERGA